MTNVLLVLVFIPLLLAFAPTSSLEGYSKVEKVIDLTEIGGNLSGITYNHDTQTYFLIQNNYGHIFEYDSSFSKPLRVIAMNNLEDKDTEDIVYLGQEQYAIASETNKILIVTIKAGQTEIDMDASRADVQLFQLPEPSKKNLGLEGICYSKQSNQFFAVQEDKPKRLFRFTKPNDNLDYRDAATLNFDEPFDAFNKSGFFDIFKNKMADLSSCLFDERTGHLILMSHESSRLMELDAKGSIVRTLDLSTVVPQYEGMTIGPQKELILVSEPNSIVIMK
ncbi:SdiA-regulated domain-containing protein [Bdellovibrio bacteriovorus]